MANPWDADEIIAPARSASRNPWDDDEIIDPAPGDEIPMELEVVGAGGGVATPETQAADDAVLAEGRALYGMDRMDRFAAGAGASVDSSIRGVKQLATSSLGAQAEYGARMLESMGLSAAAEALRSNVASPALGAYAGHVADEAESRRINAPLLDTGAGQIGNVTGHAAQILAPAGTAALAARVPAVARTGAAPALNAFARMAAPSTVRGAAVQGAAMGAVQPVVADGERASNVAAGAGFGAAAAAVAPVATAAVRAAGRAVPAIREPAQRRAAARVINEFAENPAAIQAAAQNPRVIVPGSRPTLAEATGDAGLAGLQDTLASSSREFGVGLTRRQQASNLARVEALRGAFGGADDAAAAAIREERDKAASVAARALRGIRNPASPAPPAPQNNPFGSLGGTQAPAPSVTPPALVISLEPVDKALSALAAKADRRPAVQSALQYVRNLTREPVRSADEAWNLRKTIGDLMDGKLGGDQAAATTARRELMVVRGILDREMAKAYPGWGKFLRDYKDASRVADQVDVGAELLATGRAVRSATNDPHLTPAAFARAAGNMDRTVQRATGFRRASADRALTQQQMGVVDDVRRDLERFARTQQDALPAGNSATMRRATGANDFRDAVGPVGAAMVEPVAGGTMMLINAVRKNYGEKVVRIVEEAMLDPERAAEILATLPSGQRQRVVRQIAPYINRAWITSAASAPAAASDGE